MNLQFVLDLAQTSVLAMLLFRRVRMDRRIGQNEINRLQSRLADSAEFDRKQMDAWDAMHKRTVAVSQENGVLKAQIEALTLSANALSADGAVQ